MSNRPTSLYIIHTISDITFGQARPMVLVLQGHQGRKGGQDGTTQTPERTANTTSNQMLERVGYVYVYIFGISVGRNGKISRGRENPPRVEYRTEETTYSYLDQVPRLYLRETEAYNSLYVEGMQIRTWSTGVHHQKKNVRAHEALQ